MKVAIILGGQPRFTAAFQILLNQLQGFDSADMFMCLWSTPWATNVQQARAKIVPLLESYPKYNLRNLIVLPQPQYKLPPHSKDHNTEEKESVRWWYKRRYGMWLSSYLAYYLIDQQYDAVIKIRGEGHLDRDLDISKLDLSSNLIFPSAPRHGRLGKEICDQFVVGTHKGMEFYVDMVNRIDSYIPEVCSYWEDNVHDWASEHLLSYHLDKYSVQQVLGDFKHILKGHGRSVFDDKDLHLPIGNII